MPFFNQWFYDYVALIMYSLFKMVNLVHGFTSKVESSLSRCKG